MQPGSQLCHLHSAARARDHLDPFLFFQQSWDTACHLQRAPASLEDVLYLHCLTLTHHTEFCLNFTSDAGEALS